jgi:Putative  PD-(D/E)XK family member, (DUF4420)
MKASESLANTWREVEADASCSSGYHHRRIPLNSTFPVHAGVHGPSRNLILILEIDRESLGDVKFADKTRGFRLAVYSEDVGQGERTVIRVEEINREYRKMFEALCGDILEHWISASTPKLALNALRQRLEFWKKCFQRGPSEGLSRNDHAALYGELFFIERGIKGNVPVIKLIKGWQGPNATNQDFLFGPRAVEVKTVTANDQNRIHINNARQLDSTGLELLFLYRSAFDFRDGAGRLLAQLMASIRTVIIEKCPDATREFEDRLLMAGYVEGVPNEFDGWGFTLRAVDVYDVRDGFPRLLESGLMPGISEVEYILNLGSASKFKTEEVVLWPQLGF